jgi:hypothetical protein
MVLRPGESKIDYAQVSDWYDMTKPGTYTIQVSAHVTNDPKSDVVKSNIITVTVLPADDPPTAQQLRTGFASRIDAETNHRVGEIMRRALARDYSVVVGWTEGNMPAKVVTRISWVPPTNEDYAQITLLGENAVPALAAYVAPDATPGGFVQLLAVDFLASIRSRSVIRPLGQALDQRNWQVARLAALEALGQRQEEEAISLVQSMFGDNDPLISDHAKQILALTPESSANKSGQGSRAHYRPCVLHRFVKYASRRSARLRPATFLR